MITCGCFKSPLPCLRRKFQRQTPSLATDNEDEDEDDDSGIDDPFASSGSSFLDPHNDDSNRIFMRKQCLHKSEPACRVDRHYKEHLQMLSREEVQVPLSDGITPRRNPKMRLLTSSSTISDESGSSSPSSSSRGGMEASSSEWSLATLAIEPSPQVFDVGLMVTMENGKCRFNLVADSNFPEIHPNVYAPASLSDMRVLYGGGSGVAVFGGHHPELGDVVMKHGGYKDTEELFALATISEELQRRGSILSQETAALDMQRRLPSFKMIYMSPNHIMDRGKELVGILRKFVKSWSLTHIPSVGSIQRTPKIRKASNFIRHHQPQLDVGMKIRIYEGQEEASVSFVLDTQSPAKQSLSVILPMDSTDFLDSKSVQVRGNAYDSLKSVVEGLMPIMTENMFKFTLAQKTIGGPSPKTGNQWLYEGKLTGHILTTLVDQLIAVIRNLQALTMPEEIDVVKFIREEVTRFELDESGLRASDISDMADAFCGNAIKKNFHPEKGRGLFLRTIAKQFREGSLVLFPEEEIPAKHVGSLLQGGALMSDTFVDAPMEPTVLQPHPHFWRNILRRAVDPRSSMSPTALKRLWTCGLTDAGIHNLFVSETDLYFFDLGKPQLMSLPGFLTKFLFSFFHTLGMEDDGNGSWVRRFVKVGDKLALSKETLELLPKAYDAFEECLDRIIEEVLDNDKHMRWLLLEYITMQLLSDTAFCLQKWRVKGGGKSRDGNHQSNHEKWLWRALWDIYVAFDINTSDSWYRFDVEHPHFRDSLRATSMETFTDSVRTAFTDSYRSTNASGIPGSYSMGASVRMSGTHEDSILNFLEENAEEEEDGDPLDSQ